MKDKLKIAFCNRPYWDNPLGGDGVQMLKTKQFLEKKYNVKIDIITDANNLNEKYDLIHIFNYVTIEVTKPFFDKALELKIPIASSSIYWDYSYIFSTISRYLFHKKFTHQTGTLLKIITKVLAKTIGRPKLYTSKFRNIYRFFIENSDVILPNSIEEAILLQKFAEIDCSSKIRVVYNGYEPPDNNEILSKTDFFAKYNIPENYILEVGRVETIKNQINVIASLLNNPEIPIVFVGKHVESHYSKKLKKLAVKRGNVFFIDFVPHEEINSFYKYAKVHILPSLRESPGLVSLEALSNGCPIIISNQNHTPLKTYFSTQKYIVDPLDIDSIKNTILSAYTEQDISLDNISKFTWEVAADQTWDAYNQIFKKGSHSI